MHEHLREWRLYRGLTLEDVAATIGKKHSTVSRWERGILPLQSRDLQALAKIYGATTKQLQSGPENAELVARIDEVQFIIEGLDDDSREHWLAIGRAMQQSRQKRAG